MWLIQTHVLQACGNSQHEAEQPSHRPCPFQSCRAPELAAGFIPKCLPYLLALGHRSIVGLLTESGMRKDAVSRLMDDWVAARSRIQSELLSRTCFWSALPWKLCAIVHIHLRTAQESAQICLRLWDKLDAEGRRSAHPMSRRFLDESRGGIPGTASDTPLRKDLESFASGAPMAALRPEFRKWVLARQVHVHFNLSAFGCWQHSHANVAGGRADDDPSG